MKDYKFKIILLSFLVGLSYVGRSQYNTNLGSYAGNSGNCNTSLGYYAGDVVTGNHNNSLGYRAGKKISSGTYNVINGSDAAQSLTTGVRNIFIGYRVGVLATSASDNTYMGYKAGTLTTTGLRNVFIGAVAGYYTTTGVNNLYMGYYSGYTATGSNNIFIGYRSGYYETESDKLYIENSSSSSPLIYGEFDNDFVTINGKLGIGTSTIPTDFDLAVEGKIIAREVKVESLPWSDFVFKDGYNLMPLSSLKSYIQENQHLPDIPSESDVKADGISLGKMDALLLQKIEELTLYVIALKEENQKLESRLKVIEK